MGKVAQSSRAAVPPSSASGLSGNVMFLMATSLPGGGVGASREPRKPPPHLSYRLRMSEEGCFEVNTREGEPICWFLLSPRNEPVLWGAAAGDYKLAFLFGPLGQFGNILVPRWGAISLAMTRCAKANKARRSSFG